MPLREQKYIRNITTAKLFGNKIRVVYMPTLRNSGVEAPSVHRSPKGSVNEEKLEENIRRAKSKIFELAMCNPWEHFATLTIDAAKYDRHNLKKFHTDNAQWLRNYNRINDTNIKYLIIPEQHKDGTWHEHGLFHGIPQSHLTPFTLDQNIPCYIRKKLQEGHVLYNWEPYATKFGYCIIEPVQNHEAISKYVMKYITKDLSRCVSKLGAHMYYASKGLQRAQVLKKGTAIVNFEYTYQGEYASIVWADATEEMLQKVNDGILSNKEIQEKEKRANDTSISDRGISNRPASTRKFTKNLAILQTNTRLLCKILRANSCCRLDPSPVQEILYFPDELREYFDYDTDIYPGITGVPDMVFQ